MRNHRFIFVLIFLAGVYASLQAQPAYESRNSAVLTTAPAKLPVKRVPAAAVAGNGDIGLTLGGNPDHLTFYLGKNDFWRAHPVYPGGGIAFPGGFDIMISDLAGASYRAEQQIGKARIAAEFGKGKLRVEMNTIVSATSNNVLIELTANRNSRLKFNLWPAEGNTSEVSKGKDNDVYWAVRSFANTPMLEWPSHVAIAVKVLNATTFSEQSVELPANKKVVFVLSMFTNHDRVDWKSHAISNVRSIDENAVARIKESHEKWWSDFWSKSEIQIPDKMLEKYYYTSQYLLGSSSRKDKFAPGIWGPFITQDSSLWGGDYHLNYNYQAPYWAAFSSNQIGLTDNFDQPILDYMEKGKAHARDLLGQNGIYYPVGIGPKGLVTTRWPLTGDEMLKRYATTENTIDGGYKFLGQKINAVFSVGNMLMRFYSTYDSDYAKRVYPYMQQCAIFWEEYLKFENGRYVIYMDHFNEVMPNIRNKGIWRNRLGDFNSTLSIGLVKMLFKGMLDVSEHLNVDAERRDKWKHIVNHLSQPPVGEVNGRMALKSVERNVDSDNPPAVGLSRVSIHGLILPGGVAGPKTDPKFNKILLSDISHWKDNIASKADWANTSGNGIETCYPAAVRVGYSADSILMYLKERISAQSLPNFWITQGGGGIETLAAVPLTINEMLMQSYEGVIRVFPNWNKQKDAGFKTLRAYGAFLVSSKLEKGNIQYVDLVSEKGRVCVMENPWPGRKIKVVRGNGKTEFVEGTTVSFSTSVNERLRLTAM